MPEISQEEPLDDYMIGLGNYTEALLGSTLLHRVVSSTSSADSLQSLLAKATVVRAIDQRNKDGDTALMLAVRAGHEEKVRALVAAGANVGIRNIAGETPLSQACSTKTQYRLVDILLGSPTAAVAMSMLDANGNAALGAAVHARYRDLTEKLLRAGACVNLPGVNGSTPLEILVGDAVRRRRIDQLDVKLLDMLLAAGALVGGRDKKGRSILRKAVTAGSHQAAGTDFVKKLLQAGANPWIPDGDGESPFAIAASVASDDVIVAMLEAPGHGSEDIVNKHTSLLMIALHEGRERLAAAMIRAGADVTRTAGSATPVQYLCLSADEEMAARLIKDITCNKSILAKRVCDTIKKGRVKILKALMEAGVNLSRIYHDSGKTSLMLACEEAVVTDLAAVLLDAGVGVNARDFNGRTALFYAVETGGVALVRLLLERGADGLVTDNGGKTVLMLNPPAGVVAVLMEYLGEPEEEKEEEPPRKRKKTSPKSNRRR
jgi:ankyrin repeat protein